MDKRKPSYDLEAIRSAAGTHMTFTSTAVAGAAMMGMTRADMVSVIRSLTRDEFFKSVTTFHDHRVWMDVYHTRADGYDIYIKFVQDTVTEFTCTSFKER
ncbi:type II toxin-antitoxin system MqsR family toxin [Glycocaulis alkaliphilus]|uniref:type II toxin-antitoxin system MqsR family toxin n=1 Tax=Glycocaulis alkaliphilus TaxID=1434191 RepID=UPI000FD8A467|nr:type II toxin-antitoxin system MqsR family toxin [Glycocaulis alkaliphilus]GGB66511.1 hypothetical protein GCM10007417_02860 [Glycocaulis alkaliphilus]